MKITKTVILAGFTALALGVGTAMAQSEMPIGQNAYQGPRTWTTIDQVQSGAPDVNSVQYGVSVQTEPFRANDYGNMANPG